MRAAEPPPQRPSCPCRGCSAPALATGGGVPPGARAPVTLGCEQGRGVNRGKVGMAIGCERRLRVNMEKRRHVRRRPKGVFEECCCGGCVIGLATHSKPRLYAPTQHPYLPDASGAPGQDPEIDVGQGDGGQKLDHPRVVLSTRAASRRRH
eukprot:scaffold17160_cov81-Isochrysis_galbana.AAC.1